MAGNGKLQNKPVSVLAHPNCVYLNWIQIRTASLTLWLPRLDAVGFDAPGDVGRAVHMRRYADHSVELTDAHRVTQLIYGVEKGVGEVEHKAFSPKREERNSYAMPANAKTNKHEALFETKIRLCACRNECSLHLLTC